jgi:hypothetical protein
LGKIGYGYGSEWHLLRYLGRHREKLDGAIINETERGERVEWLDFGFNADLKFFDVEPQGLGFIDNAAVFEKWRKEFWPQTGTPPNWDAVGWLKYPDGNRDLLLVEAKAHTGELKNPRGCGAKGEGSRDQIEKALAVTIKDLKASKSVEDWCGEYYQYANRLATLNFLHKNNVPARLVLIYFCGDKFPDDHLPEGDECPEDENGWKDALAEQDKTLGLPSNHPLTPYIHKVYLSVTG